MNAALNTNTQDQLLRFDPATGAEKPYPSHAAQWRDYHGNVAWLFNPWSGDRRDASDIGSDTFGLLIYRRDSVLTAHASAPIIKRYAMLDANGIQLPADSRDHCYLEDHQAGLIIDVRALHRGNHESCTSFAGESTALGRKWRLGTVEEIFLNVADRTKQDPAVDRFLFPKLGNDWSWTSTPDAKPSNPSSPGCAWGVDLYGGFAGIHSRSNEGLALPVSPLAAPASQS